MAVRGGRIGRTSFTLEHRLLARFTKAHGAVPVTRVPVVPSVGDLDGLREIGAHVAAAPARTRTAS